MAQTQPQQRYAVIIRLPRAAEVQIEDTYLSAIGTTKPSMGYHISLLGPYCLASSATSPFLPGISRVCRQARPFTVRLFGLGVFRTEDDNAVYLNLTDPAPVLALHHALLRATEGAALPENERLRIWTIENYHPHVTLGLGLSDSDLEEFLRVGRERQVDVTFEVQSIWMVEQASNGPWEYVAEYSLGATTNPTRSVYA